MATRCKLSVAHDGTQVKIFENDIEIYRMAPIAAQKLAQGLNVVVADLDIPRSIEVEKLGNE